MSGWLDFTLDELDAILERVAELEPRLDPTRVAIWRLERGSSGTLYAGVMGEGRRYVIEPDEART